jgi:hypothetical protein
MNTTGLLLGVGIGALAAFILDPSGGGRRRALVANTLTRSARRTRDGLDATARDMGNRARGVAATARRTFRGGPVSDVTLIERVRAKLGRASSHPRAIDVFAHQGEITLRGPILASEVDRLLATAESVSGVRRVIDELDPHENSDGVAALQGEGRLAGRGVNLLQRRGAPARRALVGAAVVAATGACVAAYARRGMHQQHRLAGVH